MRHRPGIGRVEYVSTCVPRKANEYPWSYAHEARVGVNRFGTSHHVEQIVNRLLDLSGRLESEASLIVNMALRLLHQDLSRNSPGH